MTFPTFSMGEYVATAVEWLNVNASGFFGTISFVFEGGVAVVEKLLLYPPVYVFIPIIVLLAWRISGTGTAVLTAFGLIFCYLMNLWQATMVTFALVFIATLAALLVAIPFGILAGVNKTADQVIKPIMDFMQTMPPWVYLVPAVILFSLGRAPAIMATVIFALPPPLRLTALGIKQVPVERLEVGKAFGATRFQVLFKIQLPSALPSIMTGVNQCIMFSFAMVVLAGLIGAGGLGGEVIRGLTRMLIGTGLRAGVAMVILAIILDRLSQDMVELVRKGSKKRIITQT